MAYIDDKTLHSDCSIREYRSFISMVSLSRPCALTGLNTSQPLQKVSIQLFRDAMHNLNKLHYYNASLDC